VEGPSGSAQLLLIVVEHIRTAELLTCAYASVSTRPHDLLYLLSIVLVSWQLRSEKLQRVVARILPFCQALRMDDPKFFFSGRRLGYTSFSIGLEDAPSKTYACIYCHWVVAQFKTTVSSRMIVDCGSWIIYTIPAV